MDFRKVLNHYRNQPNHFVQRLWDKIEINGVNPDSLRDILMFYLQHRMYSPVLQKSYDSIVMKLTEKSTSKKMKNVLIQIVDEVAYCLDPGNIVDSARMYGSSINIDLLNCLLLCTSLPPVVDTAIFERVIGILNEPHLNIVSVEDRCKALVFLTAFCPEMHRGQLSMLMSEWLQFSQPSQAASQFFSRVDVTEVDGSPANSLTTVLSLSNNMSFGHTMSVLTFSQLRLWMASFSVNSKSSGHKELITATLVHCSVLINQCSKKANSLEDSALQISIICEVLDLLYQIVEIDTETFDECLCLVKQIEIYKEVSIRIKIWKFYLTFDKPSADVYTEKTMKDLISRCFTVGSESYELLNILIEHAESLQPFLIKYHPNLFKIFATHPQSLIEEFIELVPHLTKSCDTDDTVEVFHRLVDLPVLSATVCVHQTPILIQAGYTDPVLTKIFNQHIVNGNVVYDHFIKTTSISQHTSQIIHLYPEFFSQLDKLTTQGLVVTCTQACVILLDTFLSSVTLSEASASAVLPFMLSRLALVFQVQGYKENLHCFIADHLKKMFSRHPTLVYHESVRGFITNVKNIEMCPSVYLHLIWAFGEYTTKSELLSEHFEIVECSLWEILATTTDTSQVLNNLHVMVTTLARLSCKSQDLLPRAVLSLDKVLSYNHDNQSPVVLALNQLSTLLKNPNVASVVLAPAGEGDKTMTAMIKAVTLFTG